LVAGELAQGSAVCTKQNLGKEYSMLPTVTTHSSFTVKEIKQRLVELWKSSNTF